MIIITGAAGFIGSCLVSRLNEEGFHDLVLVDDFSRPEKERNFANKKYRELVDREAFFTWVKDKEKLVQFVLHMGARTDTTEQDKTIFDHLNLRYSQRIWQLCTHHAIPLIYASSAATYGDGSLGFEDRHDLPFQLQPLNPYGESKNEFDKWALQQEEQPFFWAGLKFFNVYGPNEYHKGRMASVVWHTYRQVQETGQMRLFRSHRPDIADGQQKRDFVYVKDLCEVVWFLMQKRKGSGLYNLGTGKARSFWDLAEQVFKSLGMEPRIHFIDTPEDIRDTYQYFTEAPMQKLRNLGYHKPFTSLEAGVGEYVEKYLAELKIL
jgi:ADP-L-glycero-D-manno-heptose 6-epimerase